MKIKTIINQHRRDFNAIYVCEHCEAEQEGSGYDDSYFHNNVIPSMECKNCGKVSPTTEATSGPRYADGVEL